ncbi:Methylenetetrahydrofolate dehydrogenase NAD+ [Hondaea fermentalgiana]|uniref:Methylenetetrahydrofolate dehydrogenase NAD n=1 Tax=Hondaea fermentalgiana TaxID=2315210 RepID=A0A2R5GR89_9STRA|nr:Methylenetetrahydrofolate dehydrogenase NAD+ [Hondaea fermentalgiana]|eukprot:GBG32278.1 Methylenetetrahydrofolate dehydrogenase NAD+ [Hondaea fermentalgiana]
MASTGDDAARKVNATEVAEPFRQETQRLVQAMPAEVKPLLVGFLASEDVASKRYAEWTGKSCRKDGIEFELRECKPLDLEAKVQEANEDPKVHGIMIYYPCFGAVPSFYGGRMDDHLRDLVAVEKDVEGLCYTYRHNLYHNVRQLPMISGEPSDKKCLLPCTPLALVKILEYLKVYDEALPLGDRMSGQTVTIINRSEIVGRPLGAMLANDGADVYSVDIDSIYLMRRAKMLPTEVTVEEACKKSRVIVTGVPSENYKLPSEWVQPGTVVLNVSHFKNVDEEALLQISGVRYVPLVGKVTVAMLERNLIRLINNFHLPDSNVKVVEAGGRVVNV